MDLSIIIINWNTLDLLRACLQSVYDHPPKARYEVIVVDNASQDGSPGMVQREFPQVWLLSNTENRGFAAANNQAICCARGEQILLLNSDTLVHGHVLQRSLDYMNENRATGAMGCRVLNADGSLQHSTSQFPSLLNLTLQTLGLDRVRSVPFFRRYRMLDWDRQSERAVDTVSGCFMMVRRDCIHEIGLLDEDFFFFGEETDWCRRMREAGWRVVFAPVGEVTHFGGGSSTSLNHKRDLMLTEATVRLHRKHGGVARAVCVFLLLAVFNASRFFFWSVRRLVDRAEPVANRGRHFRGVTRHIASAWPTSRRAAS